MQILITPQDIIKRCLWLEFKRFCLKDKKEDEIKKFIEENNPFILAEEDAYVVGLIKIVETPNLVHRFKDYMEEYIKTKSNIFGNRLYIPKQSLLKEIQSFKYRFPEEFKPSFEYKKGIEEVINFVDKFYTEIEKISATNIQNKDNKSVPFVSSNVVRDILLD